MIASNTASNNNQKQSIKDYKINHSFSWNYVFTGQIIIFWLISVSISFQTSPFFSVIQSSVWLSVCGPWQKENPSFRKFLWLHMWTLGKWGRWELGRLSRQQLHLTFGILLALTLSLKDLRAIYDSSDVQRLSAHISYNCMQRPNF